MAETKNSPSIILVAETGADIPAETALRRGIEIVPMHVSFGAETRDDGSFPSEEICAYYERTGELPKTSGSMPEDFTRVFDAIHQRPPQAQILYLAYSSVTTCSYQSAQIAVKGRDYVTCIDTKTVSAGQGSIVLRAAQLLEDHPDWGLEQTLPAVEDLIERSRMCFIPNDMEYLRAGGRVSNATALCGKLLSIHPLIELLDGKLIATKKPRGKLSAIIPKLIRDYAQRCDLERSELWLIWAPGLPQSTCTAAEEAARACGFQTIHWVKTGGVITTHGGKGAFGIVGFAAKE